MKESNVQRQIQLDVGEHDGVLMRNNVGSYTSDAGHRINYGVGGAGASDLIGITPVKITSEMVGSTVAVFTAIEVKTKTGRPTEKQKTFISAIIARHGIAGVARSYSDVQSLIEQFLTRITSK